MLHKKKDGNRAVRMKMRCHFNSFWHLSHQKKTKKIRRNKLGKKHYKLSNTAFTGDPLDVP